MPEQLDTWREEFTAFHGRFAPLFARRESREQCRRYLRGLLANVARKNCWQLAEQTGAASPDATQRILYQAQWDADAARDILQEYVCERFGDEDAIGVVDETGFVKKGSRSVGVKRQYSGTAGKLENCQIGVFLSYVAPRGHAFLDRRLYLPQDWCEDPSRREAAHVPQDVEFRTKQQLALEMLTHSWERGVPMKWVVGDEVYGNAGYFRQAVSAHRRRYVLAVSVSTPVWVGRPRMEAPRQGTGGRPRTKPRLAQSAPAATPVGELVRAWPADRWQRLQVAEGEKGPLIYDWGWQRVVESQEGLPGETVWLLARRAVADPTDIAYYLSNAPAKTPLLKLGQVASLRWSIEQCFEEAKGETGLDEYEVRCWHSWYRHVTLSIMAHAWLAAMRSQAGEKKGHSTGASPK
jgi:SRSO17 transposase